PAWMARSRAASKESTDGTTESARVMPGNHFDKTAGFGTGEEYSHRGALAKAAHGMKSGFAEISAAFFDRRR
ncbi:MAG: hypothetical protein ACTHLZ_07010, partial [Tepidisphaeraceae bacterium]